MKYLLLMYGAERTWDAMQKAEMDRIYAAHRAYGEEMRTAGVIRGGAELKPTATATTVRFLGGHPSTIDGPFAETKELVAGFWMWQVKSMDEAVEWLKRAPFRNDEVEIRQVFEAGDFGDNLTPELRAQEEQLRAKVASKR